MNDDDREGMFLTTVLAICFVAFVLTIVIGLIL